MLDQYTGMRVLSRVAAACNREVGIVRLILIRAVRLKASPRLLLAFGRCFPL